MITAIRRLERNEQTGTWQLRIGWPPLRRSWSWSCDEVDGLLVAALPKSSWTGQTTWQLIVQLTNGTLVPAFRWFSSKDQALAIGHIFDNQDLHLVETDEK